MLLPQESFHVVNAWKQAQMSDDEFVDLFGDVCAGVDIGCTFIPERCESEEHAWFCLKWCVETIGIKHIRFGLRWERVEARKGDIDLSYYQSFLDYLLDHKVFVTLSVGPIKTPMWREEHIPDWVWEHIQKPKSYSKTFRNSKLAGYAYHYLQRLLPVVQKVVGDRGEYIQMIQAENEPFTPFGWLKIRTSHQYLQEVIELIREYFPQKPILLNSAGRLNVWSIIHHIYRWKFRDQKFIVGIDYYYAHNFWIKFRATRFFDPIGVSVPWDMTIKTLHRYGKKFGFNVEVTEAQMEPWHAAQEPGNSVAALKYVLLRCGLGILEGKGVVRMWGVEELSAQFFKQIQTTEHERMAWVLENIIRLKSGNKQI